MEEINQARKILIEHLNNPRLSQAQRTVLNGMLTALCWVQQSPFGSTLAELVAGTPVQTKRN